MIFTAAICTLISVTDGDTFRARCEVWPEVEVVTAVRIRGIDAPEMRGRCPAETAAAIRARDALAALLKDPIILNRVTADKYAGRVDAEIQGIAEKMIADGHARPYDGGKRGDWC